MQLTSRAGDVTSFPGGTPARAGTFMLSFDCEGKWGLADCLTPRQDRLYTTANLEAVYSQLCQLLHKYGIQATFAFTAAFTLTRDEFNRLLPDMGELRELAEPWMAQAIAGIAKHQSQGWFSTACFDLVRQAGCHEIASHGFSHLPWRERYASREALNAELDMCRRVPAFSEDAVKTFVFPRNQVAHRDIVAAHGFVAYREHRYFSSRVTNFLNELNLLSPCETFSLDEQVPIPLPAGHFLNWRHGLRRSVPAAVTVLRWRNMLRDLTRNGGVVHAWTHPENFMDGHDMFPMLEQILRFVANEREAGRLQVLTNIQFLSSSHVRTPQAQACVPAAPGAPLRKDVGPAA